jgi:hypothetical protein
MNNPQTKSKPVDPEETDPKAEVEGRKAVSDTTSVPQDGATPNTSVPQDNT